MKGTKLANDEHGFNRNIGTVVLNINLKTKTENYNKFLN